MEDIIVTDTSYLYTNSGIDIPYINGNISLWVVPEGEIDSFNTNKLAILNTDDDIVIVGRRFKKKGKDVGYSVTIYGVNKERMNQIGDSFIYEGPESILFYPITSQKVVEGKMQDYINLTHIIFESEN